LETEDCDDDSSEADSEAEAEPLSSFSSLAFPFEISLSRSTGSEEGLTSTGEGDNCERGTISIASFFLATAVVVSQISIRPNSSSRI